MALVAARSPTVHEVTVPHDGPTSKADCLNWVYQGIKLVEEQKGVRFDILVMHDSEDVIHPLALRHYNYWIPRCDFVQTPVLPLEIPISQVVGGTYIDEFTEHHLKDMIVRGRIGGLVPSAGVGSAFARDAFEDIAGRHGQLAFDVESLTEDYEIGLKLRLAGKRTLFAADTVEHEREVRGPGGTVRKVRVTEYIATREFFPTKLCASIRQRSRWILGIGFQTWAKIGWQGPLPVLYSLYRDRRALLSHVVALLGYVVVVYCLARLGVAELTGEPWTFARIFTPGTLLFWLVIVNTGLVAWRMGVKIVTLRRVYGWRQSLMSIARFPVNNFVSFLATASAARQFLHHKITKKPLRWKKTDHEFPDMEPLRRFHQKLGDILRTREGVTAEDLERGLTLSGQSGHRLGEVLEQIGAVSGAALDRAVAMQKTMPAVVPDPEAVPRTLLSAISERECEELGVLPLAEADGWAIVAACDPGQPELATKLAERLSRKIRLAYCGAERLAYARRRAYRRLRRDTSKGLPARLGERLRFAGALDDAALASALEEQAQTGEHLAEILLRRGLVEPRVLAELALPPLAGGFVSVRAEEVDTFAMRRIGYAACAFHDLVPLWPATGGRTIVSASPLAAETLACIASALGSPARSVLAPRAQLHAARVASARVAWPRGIFGGQITPDAAELAAMLDEGVAMAALVPLHADACELGQAPLALAVERGLLDPARAAAIGARVYRVTVGQEGEHRTGWLPPSLDGRDDLRVIGAAPDELVIATPTPDVRLARELRSLHPERALLWRVIPVRAAAMSRTA